MALTIKNCVATPTQVVVYFSEPLDESALNSNGGTDPNFHQNYTLKQLPASTVVRIKKATYDPIDKTTVLDLDGAVSLKKGSFLSVEGTSVSSASRRKVSGTDIFYAQINSAGKVAEIAAENAARVTQAAEDAVAYPVMTEQVGIPPSSSYGSGGGGGSTLSSGGGRLQIGQTATQAIADVLGWKLKADDPKGFVGALTQSFSLTVVEGHVEATWTPRTYAVQTDLSGGITGAQASLYTRAQEALQQSLPLLDGLYPLNPDSDPEMVTALKDIVSSQFTELVNELSYAGGPRIARVNQYFHLLLGDPLPKSVVFDPDQIGGTIGRLRNELQVQSFSHYVNTIEDEQDVTNYRILSDYVTSLAQSWINNLRFFGLGTKEAFLGTQLVLLSRQLSVIGETVGEVRFTLDSVFIGPSERQTLQLEFTSGDPSMFIEDILSWTESFAKDEGPQLIQNAGKLGVGDGFLPVVKKLHHLLREARHPANESTLPDGYRTIRVKHSLKDLEDQLEELRRLGESVSLRIPPRPFDGSELEKLRLLI